MSENYTSTSCPADKVLPKDPVPFFSDGNINFKAHDVGWIMAGIFSVIAIVTSVWLITKHLRFFYSPTQQRHIVRILLMVPIYATTSFLSYYFYTEALYFQLLRDCYEALVISSFFQLLLSYLSSPPTPANPCPQPYATNAERLEARQEVFRDLHLSHWMFPFGFVKWRLKNGGPGEGEAFLWWMRIGIGQYVILRPVSTLAAVVGQATGYYCLASWSPKFLHIWTSGVVSISVSIAMYCVLQLYMPLQKELAPYAPVLKFLSVKTVVFLTFWQETFFSFLETVGVIKDHEYWSAEAIVIGLSALASCLEMMIFGFVHIKASSLAFTYLPYRALAPPLPPPDDGSEKSHPTIPESFADWRKLEHDKARQAVFDKKLAKLPTTKDGQPYQTLRKDGTPILRQTRMLPALWKCIKMSDVARELGEETKYVVRGRSKVQVDRSAAMQEVFGQRRVRATIGVGVDEEEGEGSIEENLLRARDTYQPANDKRTPNSMTRPSPIFDPSPNPYSRASREIETPLLDGASRSLHPPRSEASEQRRREARKAEERAGWWASIKSRMSRERSHDDEEAVPSMREFQRLESAHVAPPMSTRQMPPMSFVPPSQRLEQGVRDRQSVRPRPRQSLPTARPAQPRPRQSLPPPRPASPTMEMPLMLAGNKIDILPPHQIGSPGPGRRSSVYAESSAPSTADGPSRRLSIPHSLLPRAHPPQSRRADPVPFTEYHPPSRPKRSSAARPLGMGPPPRQWGPSGPSGAGVASSSSRGFIFEEY